MPTIHIHSEEDLKQKFVDLAHAVHNMRFWQKFWHEHYGTPAKLQKERWEQKVDALLTEMELTDHERLNAIKVVRA